MYIHHAHTHIKGLNTNMYNVLEAFQSFVVYLLVHVNERMCSSYVIEAIPFIFNRLKYFDCYIIMVVKIAH